MQHINGQYYGVEMPEGYEFKDGKLTTTLSDNRLVEVTSSGEWEIVGVWSNVTLKNKAYILGVLEEIHLHITKDTLEARVSFQEMYHNLADNTLIIKKLN